MYDFYDCVLLKHGLAWAVGAGIFLLTVLLVSRRLIGFYTSLLFMLIALGASMVIEHREESVKYWNKYLPEAFHIIETKTENAYNAVKDSVTKKPEIAPVNAPTQKSVPAPTTTPAPVANPPTPVTTPPTLQVPPPKPDTAPSAPKQEINTLAEKPAPQGDSFSDHNNTNDEAEYTVKFS